MFVFNHLVACVHVHIRPRRERIVHLVCTAGTHCNTKRYNMLLFLHVPIIRTYCTRGATLASLLLYTRVPVIGSWYEVKHRERERRWAKLKKTHPVHIQIVCAVLRNGIKFRTNIRVYAAIACLRCWGPARGEGHTRTLTPTNWSKRKSYYIIIL